MSDRKRQTRTPSANAKRESKAMEQTKTLAAEKKTSAKEQDADATALRAKKAVKFKTRKESKIEELPVVIREYEDDISGGDDEPPIAPPTANRKIASPLSDAGALRLEQTTPVEQCTTLVIPVSQRNRMCQAQAKAVGTKA